MYINADDETLVKRYKEKHDVCTLLKILNGLLASIRQERKNAFHSFYEGLDYVIDTSHLTAQGLFLQELKEIYDQAIQSRDLNLM